MKLTAVPINSNPNKMSGSTCIGDTRMPVRDFFIHLMQGGTIRSFIDCHGGWLEVDQLKAVLQFAANDMESPHAVERARVAVDVDTRRRHEARSHVGLN